MSRYQRARRYAFWRGAVIVLVAWTIFTTTGALILAK